MQFSFYGARLKVKRAYKHINELEIWFRALVRENINATRVHKDSTPGHESDHVSISRPKGFSEVVSPIVGDVVHNLRTALDFIAAEIVKNEPECIREISYFPLGGTKNDLISSSRYRFIQRAAPDLASVIADIVKPYKAGGDWRFNAINELDRMDKHRVLVPSVTISNHIVTGIREDQEENPPTVSPGAILMIVGITAADGTVIQEGRAPRPSTLAYIHNQRNGYPAVEIVFGKGEVFEDQPIIPTLRQLAQLVDGVIDTLEAHCK